MGEGVDPGPAEAGDHQMCPFGLFNGLQGDLRPVVNRIGQNSNFELPADDGHGRQDLVGRRRQPR